MKILKPLFLACVVSGCGGDVTEDLIEKYQKIVTAFVGWGCDSRYTTVLEGETTEPGYFPQTLKVFPNDPQNPIFDYQNNTSQEAPLDLEERDRFECDWVNGPHANYIEFFFFPDPNALGGIAPHILETRAHTRYLRHELEIFDERTVSEDGETVLVVHRTMLFFAIPSTPEGPLPAVMWDLANLQKDRIGGKVTYKPQGVNNNLTFEVR